MRFQLLLLGAVLAATTIILTGCPGNQTTPNANTTNVNKGNTAGNTAAPGNTGELETTKTPPPETTNNAPTLTPAFKAYCDAMTRKDEAALRKVFSQATLKSLEADMKAENEKSLVAYLSTEQISNNVCEVRNEQISGDTGTAEVKTEGMPNGARIKFVRENGEWKVTNEIPELPRDAAK